MTNAMLEPFMAVGSKSTRTPVRLRVHRGNTRFQNMEELNHLSGIPWLKFAVANPVGAAIELSMPPGSHLPRAHDADGTRKAILDKRPILPSRLVPSSFPTASAMQNQTSNMDSQRENIPIDPALLGHGDHVRYFMRTQSGVSGDASGGRGPGNSTRAQHNPGESSYQSSTQYANLPTTTGYLPSVPGDVNDSSQEVLGDNSHEEHDTMQLDGDASGTTLLSQPSRRLTQRKRTASAARKEEFDDDDDGGGGDDDDDDNDGSEDADGAYTVAASRTPNTPARATKVIKRANKPRSMTSGAIDSRSRQAEEKKYKDTLRSYIDEDVLERVEQEGGITPAGRLIKAACMMFERLGERLTQLQGGGNGNASEVAKLQAEVGVMRRKIEGAMNALV